MNRLLPAPLLSAALFALWLGLNQSASPGHLVFAAFLALALPLLTAPLRPLPVRIHRPGVVIRLVLTVALDVVRSNFQVARGVLRSGWRKPRSVFVRIPLDVRDPTALAALAIITTVVPGTVWSELALDRSALLLHVWDVENEAAFAAYFKARYERPLMEIFE
jgi:multicomponent K+:H+ antiporter subunit E